MSQDQLTVRELQNLLSDHPDDELVNAQTGGAVGRIVGVSRNADGVLVKVK